MTTVSSAMSNVSYTASNVLLYAWVMRRHYCVRYFSMEPNLFSVMSKVSSARKKGFVTSAAPKVSSTLENKSSAAEAGEAGADAASSICSSSAR